MERTDKPRLLNRLNRIEGQVRGIARMVEQDRYCIDILTQLHAVRAAVRRVETELLKSHLGHSVAEAMTTGDVAERERKTAELVELMDRLRG
ncbi:metal-sensitive transcriptional regulator [Phenylobacterium sp.]|uniref:metal-sensitive transcriptional regulator n=1 Tax=Phenylobacterium sp. TaxID=1871053 RepID=UPI003BA99B31